MIRWLAVGAGTILAGFAGLLAGWHVSFPGAELVRRARWEVQEAGDGRWALDAADASPWHLTGVALEDVTLYSIDRPRRRRRGGDAEEPPATAVLRADRVAARVALLPLLRGERVVPFVADAWGGRISGELALAEARRALRLEARDVDVSQLPLRGRSWEVEATGTLRADADVDIDFEEPKRSEGEVHVSFDGLAIRAARVSGFDLGSTTFEEAVLDLVVEKGRIEVEKGVFRSDLFDAELSGNATIRKELRRWRMRIEAVLELDEELDGMLRMVPRVRDARDDEGRYHFVCTGSPTRPLCRPDRVRARRRSKDSRGTRRTSPLRALRDRDTGEQQGKEPDRDRPRRPRFPGGPRGPLARPPVDGPQGPQVRVVGGPPPEDEFPPPEDLPPPADDRYPDDLPPDVDLPPDDLGPGPADLPPYPEDGQQQPPDDYLE